MAKTFAGLIRSRRLVRDFARSPVTSAAMVKLGSIYRWLDELLAPGW